MVSQSNKSFRLFPKILSEQKVVVVPGQVADKFLNRLKAHGTKTATVSALSIRPIGRGYDVSVHRTQMLKKVRLLLEHGHTEAAGEGFLARVDA